MSHSGKCQMGKYEHGDSQMTSSNVIEGQNYYYYYCNKKPSKDGSFFESGATGGGLLGSPAPSPPTNSEALRTSVVLKRLILDALKFSMDGRPLTLGQIVEYVRANYKFPSFTSVDELIYNTLFGLCSSKRVVKVIGTSGNEIRYHIPESYNLKKGGGIDLTFRGVLSHEFCNYHKPPYLHGKNWWTRLKRGTMRHLTDDDKQEAESKTMSFGCQNKVHMNQEGLFPCLPVTDSMICESFGARAGLRAAVEGLQRPNTPDDHYFHPFLHALHSPHTTWEDGDKNHFVMQEHGNINGGGFGECKGSTFISTTDSKYPLLKPKCGPQEKSTDAPLADNVTHEKVITSKHITFLKEINDLLNSYAAPSSVPSRKAFPVTNTRK